MLLDRQITIQFSTKTTSGSGEPGVAWGGDVTEWAHVEPLSGREYYAQLADQLVAVELLRFTIRFRSDVRPGTSQILHQGRTYNVRHVAETQRNRWLEIEADCKVA